MRFAMPIRKQLGLTWNTTVSRAIRLAAGAFTMKNAIRVWRTMGIEVATVNNEMLCDMEAMEALAWRIHQRMGKRYQNRVEARRKRQDALLNTLRACFGLKPA